MRSLARLTLAFALALVASQGGAAPVARGACPRGEGRALGDLACDLRDRLRGTLTGAVVVGLAPNPQASPALRADIAIRAAVELALALGPGNHAWPLAETAERAAALAAKSTRPVLGLTPALDGDRFALTLERLDAPGAQTTPKGDESARRVTFRHALDAEIRSFLPAVALVRRTLRRVGSADPDVHALACADVRGRDAVLLAMVGRGAVSVAPLTAGSFERTLVKLPQKSLAEVAPVPLREPISTAWFTPNGALEVGSSDRAHGKSLVVLSNEQSDLGARLPWPGGGCANLDGLFVSPRAVPCRKGEAALLEPTIEGALDVLTGARVVARNGSVRLVRAGRLGSDGSVVITDGKLVGRLEHAGAALALGDLDGDGVTELVTSVETADPRSDGVVIYSWRGSALEERLRVPIPTGVRALAICPPGANASAPVVIAGGGSLWMLQ